jgi:Lrp/AsnC family transcriptional regulator for asnA, asnC and gidA
MVVIAMKIDGALIEGVAARIAQYDEVVYLATLAGSYDLLAEARFRDPEHLREFLTRRLRGIEGVRDSETFVNLEILKETYY